MLGHFDDTDLARIVGGSSTAKEAGEAVLHIAVCAQCHCRLLDRHPIEGRRFLESWLGDFASGKDLDVGDLAGHLPQLFSALGEEEIRAAHRAPSLLRALEGLSEAHQRLHLANSTRFHTLAFLETCQAEARRHWHSSPEEAVRWASLAVVACEEAEPSLTAVYGKAVWADTLARGWAYLANGHRIAGDLHAADRALAQSWQVADSGTGSPEARAEILALEGSLRRDQRRFEEAWLAAFEAERIYQALGHREAAALVALVGSSALAEAGDLEEAIRKLRRSLRELSEGNLGRRAHFGLLQHLACTLDEAGRPEDAARLLPQIRELSLQLVDEPLTQTRLGWLEGRIQAQLSLSSLAEAAFRKVCQDFLLSGSPYDAALVSLDLAVLLIEDGRQNEAAELAHDLVPIFHSRGIHREAKAAGMLVAQALSDRKATVDLVRQVATYLRRARRDPSHRFPH